jgi:predicted DCC family thiol-disulfide oxidoreductase YuxK
METFHDLMDTDLAAEPKNIRIYYDGACPFCNSYARLLRIRNSFGVELIDARGYPLVARQFAADGMSLNAGMIVEIGSTRYHGAAAIQFLALIDTPRNAFNWINHHLFRYRWLARCLYPVMRWGRLIILVVTGRGSIRDR